MTIEAISSEEPYALFDPKTSQCLVKSAEIVTSCALTALAAVFMGVAAVPAVALASAVAGNKMANVFGDLEDPLWEQSILSKNYHLDGAHHPTCRIGGIAGIGANLSQNKSHAIWIQQLAKKHHIDWTYNASHTTTLDLAEALLLNYQGHSSPAKLLIQSWENFEQQYAHIPKAKYLQICHSQGALHVKNALRQTPLPLRKKIVVLAIAPATIIPRSLCHASYNYASRRDVVPYGKLFSDAITMPFDPQRNYTTIEEFKELQILTPHPAAPLFDHEFESPTFAEVLAVHISDSLRN